jgi:hypothetical protein
MIAAPLLRTASRMAITTLLVCAAPLAGSVRGWDSDNKGDPTHATHSYLTEWAIAQLKGQFPEFQQFRTDNLCQFVFQVEKRTDTDGFDTDGFLSEGSPVV